MAKDEDRDDPDLAVVEDDSPEGEIVTTSEEDDKAKGKTEAAEEGDERLASDDEDAAEDSSVTEEVRARRRQERKDKKARERAARARNQTELRFLRARNDQLEARFSQLEQRALNTEALTLDGQIAQLDSQMRVADDVIANAIKTQNGAEHVEATNIKTTLQAAKQRLIDQKARLEYEARQPQAQRQPVNREAARVDPETISHANAWRAKNPWFKGRGADQDSNLVSVIDDQLAAEGYDPTTEEYWDELTSRAKEVVPHRFERQQSNGGERRSNGSGGQPRPANGGPRMANGQRERSLRPGEVYVSAERKAAMIEAGLWDDEKLRNKMLKRYKEHDERAAAEARVN